MASSIRKWIEAGCPRDEWFTIVRFERLDDVKDGTHVYLAQLILDTLQTYGDFETREYQHGMFAGVFAEDYYHVECPGHKFQAAVTTGFVNGERVPVLAVGIDAKIIDDKAEE